MTITPLPGLWRDGEHRYYYGTEGPFPSVTRIIDVLNKPALVNWAKRETAACAVRNMDALAQMIEQDGRDEAQRWLASIPDRQRDEAANRGSEIHQLADSAIRGEQISPTGILVPYLRAYRDFLATVRPEIHYSETLVLNRTLGYGGTFDIGCLIDGAWTLLDIKTGGNVYDETALQLAGYAEAEFTAAHNDPTPIPLPDWERYGVIHLQPDDWTLIPYDVTDATRAAFRASVELHRWSKQSSQWTKGTPLTKAAFEIW